MHKRACTAKHAEIFFFMLKFLKYSQNFFQHYNTKQSFLNPQKILCFLRQKYLLELKIFIQEYGISVYLESYIQA